MKSLFLALLLSLSSVAFGQPADRFNYGLPAGTVITFAGSACPSGFYKADGTQVSRTSNARLFTAIGVAHGSGNGTSTFHLPDYRGLFLRMIDETKGNDPDKASRTAMNAGGAVGNLVGSVQTDMFASHTHTYNVGENSINTAGGNPEGTSAPPTAYATSAAGGNETRPKNAYVVYCIKF